MLSLLCNTWLWYAASSSSLRAILPSTATIAITVASCHRASVRLRCLFDDHRPISTAGPTVREGSVPIWVRRYSTLGGFVANTWRVMNPSRSNSRSDSVSIRLEMLRTARRSSPNLLGLTARADHQLHRPFVADPVKKPADRAFCRAPFRLMACEGSDQFLGYSPLKVPFSLPGLTKVPPYAPFSLLFIWVWSSIETTKAIYVYPRKP